uniref:Roc domain-containing protein n=1 Tax=Aplanochytrium stocchinoi TaxID=215587 RepID=A0A7S3PEE6_9STRA|mmetsp:Transcript_22162/g.28323  ORF Transcript_22162/g.28323 Transcript_22162/m.28323 type:complete len:841 (+) Transcript_22162:127-2649(+)
MMPRRCNNGGSGREVISSKRLFRMTSSDRGVWQDAKTAADLLYHISEGFQKLRLWNSSFTTGGENENVDLVVSKLAERLKKTKTLEALSLNGNNLGEHVLTLAKALEKNTSLRFLEVRNNKISDNGAKAIANSLKTCNNLIFLNLSGNEISNDGVFEIGQSLEYNSTLTKLSLHHNRIEKEGALSLMRCIEKNKMVTALDISDNRIEGSNFAEIQAQLLLQLKANKNSQKRSFLEALKSGSGPWNRSKVFLIGEEASGKSATIQSLNGKSFDKDWEPYSYHPEYDRFEFETSADQSRWKQTRKHGRLHHTTRFAAKLAVDKLKCGGFQHEPEPDSEDMHTSLSAIEKSDTLLDAHIDSALSEYEGVSVFRNHHNNGITFSVFEYNENRNLIHKFHRLFFTTFGTYLIVFDMQKVLQKVKGAIEYLKFWFESIRFHAPEASIVFVGTFHDIVNSRGDLETISETLFCEVLSSQLFPFVAQNDCLWFYPVDNPNGLGLGDLHEVVLKTITIYGHSRKIVSIRWLHCLDELLNAASIGAPCLTLRDVTKCASMFGINSLAEISAMLNLFHEFGFVIYSTSTEALRRLVVLNPQFLVDSLNRVIVDCANMSQEAIDRIEKMGLKNDVEKLCQTGLATYDLLECIWGKDHVDYLVDVMREGMLFHDWSFRNTDKLFLIPSFLQDKVIGENETCQDEWSSKCIFDFSDRFLPAGVFQRLVCLCVSYSETIQSSKEPVCQKGWSKIYFGSMNVVVLSVSKDGNSISVAVTDQRRASFCVSLLTTMLRKLNEESLSGSLSWKTFIEHSNSRIPLEKVRNSRELKPWTKDNITPGIITSSIDLSGFDIV